VSPELELGRFLNGRAPGLTPNIVGAIEYSRLRAEPSTLAVLEAYVPNEGTAWAHAREELRRFFERVLTRHRDDPAPAATPRRLGELSTAQTPATAGDVIGAYLDLAALLGRRTAEMHLAMASNVDDGSFTPVAYSTLDRRSHYQSVRNLVGKTVRLLRDSIARIPVGIAEQAVRKRCSRCSSRTSASASPAFRFARTATSTSSRCCTPGRTSSSSTSTDRRRRRWRSGAGNTTACATSPA
jgi:maltose alpha-D-glucosyltransferase/alpha-amylase